MKQEVRNKIGLLLFIFLILLGGCLVALYVFLGHNWNFAATEIDDVSGNMDEYLVIVYDGTTNASLLPKSSSDKSSSNTANATGKNTSNSDATNAAASNAAASASAEGSVSAAATGGGAGAGDTSASSSSVPANNEATDGSGASSGTAAAAANTATSNAANSENSASSNATGATNGASSNAANNSETQSTSGGLNGITGVGERFMRYFNLVTGAAISEEDATEGQESVLNAEIPEGLSVGDALAVYVQKHANVLTLYTKDPSHYAEGTVFKKGSYKIGVFGLSKPTHFKEVQAQVDSLKAQGASTVLAIVTNANYLAAVDGVDIAIVTQGSTTEMKSYPDSGTLYVESSQVGTIDAIIVSPNHIVSTKTL